METAIIKLFKVIMSLGNKMKWKSNIRMCLVAGGKRHSTVGRGEGSFNCSEDIFYSL